MDLRQPRLNKVMELLTSDNNGSYKLDPSILESVSATCESKLTDVTSETYSEINEETEPSTSLSLGIFADNHNTGRKLFLTYLTSTRKARPSLLHSGLSGNTFLGKKDVKVGNLPKPFMLDSIGCKVPAQVERWPFALRQTSDDGNAMTAFQNPSSQKEDEEKRQQQLRISRSHQKLKMKYRHQKAKYMRQLQEMKRTKSLYQKRELDQNTELRLKQFENDRIRLLLLEAEAKSTDMRGENDRLKTEIEKLKEEARSVEQKNYAEISSIKWELKEIGSKLNEYEQMEQKVDQMIIDAASFPDTPSFHNLLPTSSSRRMLQALEQTRKANLLEQELKERKSELFSLYDERESLRSEVMTLKSLMNKPVSALISTILEKNLEVRRLEARLSTLSKEQSNGVYHPMSTTKDGQVLNKIAPAHISGSGFIYASKHKDSEIKGQQKAQVLLFPSDKDVSSSLAIAAPEEALENLNERSDSLEAVLGSPCMSEAESSVSATLTFRRKANFPFTSASQAVMDKIVSNSSRRPLTAPSNIVFRNPPDEISHRRLPMLSGTPVALILSKVKMNGTTEF